MNLIRLIVGDYSGDGHKYTESVFIETNAADIGVIQKAFATGVEQLGDNPLLEFEDYEWNKVDEFLADFLVQHKLMTRQEISKLDDGCRMSIKMFAILYLRIVQRGDHNIIANIIDLPALDIGGYGLLS